jgi:cardiolipin synthase A/B
MNRWISGNRFKLLENGEEFFPRVFECIAAARREVVLETFILFEDKVGQALHAALLKAAASGATVDMTIDGFGSPDLSEEFISSLTRAGVRVHMFDPGPRLWGGLRTNLFRRMHRKIVVIDGERAFVGGINYSADHLGDYGPQAKQDYSIEIEGPLVATIHDFARKALAAGQRSAGARFASALRERLRRSPRAPSPPAQSGSAHVMAAPGGADAMFVTRDNRRHTNDIERHYLIAIRSARERVVIANAYFFPGYRLLKALRRAARRGVDVRLILQGEPDMAFVKTAATLLYPHLIRGGVKIYEYCDRPLHGKVALADSEWATVGSSNLDPLSLSLNLEANVVIRDHGFNQQLSEKLEHLMAHSCKQIQAADLPAPSSWQSLRNFFVFHLLRRYPSWAGWLPAHTPRLLPALQGSESTSSRAQTSGADNVSDAGAA